MDLYLRENCYVIRKSRVWNYSLIWFFPKTRALGHVLFTTATGIWKDYQDVFDTYSANQSNFHREYMLLYFDK